jgi:uncharacterized protein YjiS (DUF1127 family)
MTAHSVSSRDNVFVAGTSLPPIRKRLTDIFVEWHRRARSRRELAALSPLDLKDIGYPEEADAEKQKPFWRA